MPRLSGPPLLLVVVVVACGTAGTSADTLTLRFDEEPDGALARAGLATVGAWSIAQGVAHTGASQAFLRPLESPWLRSGRVEATVRITDDLRQSGWRLAALQLHAGPEDSWDLALVIGPQGERYCELVERYRGTWQAQNAEATRLEPLPRPRREVWDFDAWYKLEIETSKTAVRGRITALDTGAVVCDLGYALTPLARAVRSGQVALRTDGVRTEVTSLVAEGEPMMTAARRDDVVGVLTEVMPGGDPDAGHAVADALAPGFAVARLSADEAVSLTPEEAGTLVLPDATRLPGRMAGAIDRYLAAGGRLLVVGGPLLKIRYARTDTGWLPIEEALAAVRAESILTEFGNGLEGWLRSTGPATVEARVSADSAPDGSTGVRVTVSDLRGWDTYQLPRREVLFPEGHSLVCLWARGSERTRQLLVEVVEKDGSRWIAPLAVGPGWRHYAVPTGAFRYWSDSPTKDRGGPGDYLHPEDADRMSIGIAVGHEPGGISPGAHEWSAARMGTAASPLTDQDTEPLALECLLPWYKQFRLDDVGQVSATLQGAIAGVQAPSGVSGPVWCSISRPAGMTWSGGEAPGRFVPLLQAVDSAGGARANLAWIWDAHGGIHSPGRWAQLALPYSDGLAPVVLALARGLNEPVVLAQAGTDGWSYFEDESGPQPGAYVLAKGRTGPVTVSFVVSTEDGRKVSEELVEIQPHEGQPTLARAARVTGLAAGFYFVRTTLLSDGKPIDAIEQPFTVLPVRPPNEGRVRLSADGAHFEVDGRQYHPHGCNYWPLYVAGADAPQYWGHWLSPNQYDPVAVERDLAILERLGGNVVSIQYANDSQARPLVDFLARCARHGIKANIFLPSTHPLAFDREQTRRLLEAARLPGNPSVFAYDLAWEPHLGPYEARRAHDPQWRQWLADQYGSVENAEKVFGMPLPRDSSGEVTGPSDAQLVDPSPAVGPDPRVFVCAYRRFVDDMVSVGYGEVKWFIRHELGDNTLLGARTGYGGTGQPWVQSRLPYDLVAGAAHLDFTSPEGYGLDGEWSVFRRGGFTTQYGRWAGNGKPVFWAEFGRSVFSGEEGPTDELIELQRRLYENTYRMALESGADGSACWWWPGGFRVDEKSDYGIISPDGAPRPSALELLRFSEDTLAERPLPTPTAWITFDRDASARGYPAVWEAHRDEYAAIIGAGGWVGLRTEATGTTTRSFPLVSVGNVPWAPGLPYKHLNGETHGLRIEGRSIEVHVVNTGEVAWEAGDVSVVASVGGEEVVSAAVAQPVPRYGTFTVRASLPETAGGELVLRLRFDGNGFGLPLRHQLP